MRTLHIIGWTEDGQAEMVSPPHVPIPDQIKLFSGFKVTGVLPAGLVKVEMFDSDSGRSNLAFARPAEAAEPDSESAKPSKRKSAK